MALTDLTVLSQWIRDYSRERIAYNINLFNAATQGAMVLGTETHPGDYWDRVGFKFLSGVVRRRNPYGTGSLTAVKLQNIIETLVKVAAGTNPVELNPSQWAWINQDPAQIVQLIGDIITEQAMDDMITVAINAVSSAITNVGAAVVYSNGGTFASPAPLKYIDLANGSQLFGDRQNQIAVWLMQSTPMHSLRIGRLTNAERLFKWDTVNVLQDDVGRVIVVSDTPVLKLQTGNGTSTPDIFASLGLTKGAVTVLQQNDYDGNFSTLNGNENLSRTYQAEWSYMVGVKGYAWDKVNGGHAPSTSALATGSNWDQYVTSIKDTAGVLVKSNS